MVRKYEFVLGCVVSGSKISSGLLTVSTKVESTDRRGGPETILNHSCLSKRITCTERQRGRYRNITHWWEKENMADDFLKGLLGKETPRN